jgi:hypothetical protein
LKSGAVSPTFNSFAPPAKTGLPPIASTNPRHRPGRTILFIVVAFPNLVAPSVLACVFPISGKRGRLPVGFETASRLTQPKTFCQADRRFRLRFGWEGPIRGGYSFGSRKIVRSIVCPESR